MAAPQQTSATDSKFVKDAVDVLAGKGVEQARSGGILTKNDIISIKLYVKQGLALPSVLPEVESFLNYKSIGVAGLEPSDVKVLFNNIKAHAISWTAIEDQMLKQSIDLGIAARKILSTGGAIVEIIDEMDAAVSGRKKLGVWSEEEIAGIKYTTDDGLISTEVGYIIKSMRTDVLKQQSKTQELANMLKRFEVELAGGQLADGPLLTGLQGQLSGMYDLMVRNEFVKSIADDKVAITEKKERIIQLDKDYKHFCELTATGIAGGLIGLAITGGIFGSKAENARREREAVVMELAALEAHVLNKENLQTALEANQKSFSNVHNRMLDAEQAVNLLKKSWATILQNIDASAEEFLDINDAMSLLRFSLAFQEVIDPWAVVKDNAGDLVIIFNEALEEYKKNYN
ncbi:alpha-xenorhabdolysin family binary toxin subunit A [Pseudomonas arsenicoxydans]|uniref:XaxA n=1 Tax=Pseudomonas arsenicoxydans TaxID=702115 RepID=A0A502GWT6_9PSED|nr:alpha-xenorhabdolysin family binary toxin subunit A [Pseudomonas arsenicoxydans]TPG65690.1 XaxA [Pseudomonas arsenicoxydans]